MRGGCEIDEDITRSAVQISITSQASPPLFYWFLMEKGGHRQSQISSLGGTTSACHHLLHPHLRLKVERRRGAGGGVLGAHEVLTDNDVGLRLDSFSSEGVELNGI